MTVAVAFAIGGAVYAFQDAPQRPAHERKATTSIVTDEKSGDEISVTYRTVGYSQKQIDGMKADPEARKMWAQFMPQKLEATLSTDVELTYKGAREYKLPAGKYQVSFGMLEDENHTWELRLMAGTSLKAHIKLDLKDSAVSFDYLTMNLMTGGPNEYRLALGYGKQAAILPFATTPAAEPAK